MLLEGSIERFKLTDVLGFLSRSGATGILEVHDFEEYGFIYLVEGRVEGISLPVSDTKLGRRLVEVGCLSERQLCEVLIEDGRLSPEDKREKPLGQRLVDAGLASEVEIREVMRWQAIDLVFELAHWRSGVFMYDEPAEMPHFEVRIEGDVQELLDQAQQRIEEGERPRKRALTVMEEICFGCPLAGECSPAIRARHLKDDVCLWRSMEGSRAGDSVVNHSPQVTRDRRDDDASSFLSASIDWG